MESGANAIILLLSDSTISIGAGSDRRTGGRMSRGPRGVRFPVNATTPSLLIMDSEFKTWMCLICGWMYDEAAGAPDEGIAAGTRWADVPINWTCPECGARKEDFELVEI